MKLIREPQVAGMFYPADPKVLRKQIDGYLKNVKLDAKYNHIGGLVSPHAGYEYSGEIAATAYKTLQSHEFNTVVIISPSHRDYFNGVSIYPGDGYRTPLGDISINKTLREKIVSESDIIFESISGHGSEHALEVQLPFLQVALSNFEIIPLVIGDQRRENILELGTVLSNIIDDKILIVASSDLSHYYSKTKAEMIDSRVIQSINEFDYNELQSDLENKRCEACGGGGIVALLKALKTKNYSHSKVLAHSDSGDVTGDNSEVVGYLSAIVYN